MDRAGDREGASGSYLPPEAAAHYASGYEAGRLFQGTSRLEFARSQEIIARYLPPPPAIVYDVGGGPGAYACWLARQGYEVHLLDAMPVHVEQARRASAGQPDRPIASITLGDARHLAWPDASADAVLLFGPLYHLTERADRLAALAEARRVLRPGGVLLASAISRYASVLDGLFHGYIDDPAFVQIVERDLSDGQHRNPTNHPDYFTSAFFHRPEDLLAEVEEIGLRLKAVLPVEGPAWLLPDFNARWENPSRRAQLLQAARWLEREPAALGLSAHLIGVGIRPSPPAPSPTKGGGVH